MLVVPAADNDEMEVLSPELALVDRELAARARAALPDPPDCLSRSHFGDRSGASAAVPTVVRPAARRGPGRRRVVGRTPVVASWIVFAAFVGSSLLAFIPLGESARPVFAGPAPAASGDPGGSTRLLRWVADPRADAYNVILITGARRQDRWVKGTSVRLEVRPNDRGSSSEWFVYPVYSEAGVSRFGPIAARGSIEKGSASFVGGRGVEPLAGSAPRQSASTGDSMRLRTRRVSEPESESLGQASRSAHSRMLVVGRRILSGSHP